MGLKVGGQLHGAGIRDTSCLPLTCGVFVGLVGRAVQCSIHETCMCERLDDDTDMQAMYNHADKINGPALIGVHDLLPVIILSLLLLL